MIGPGKYDAACTAARESTEGRAVLLIVVGGHSGSGFSMQAEPGVAVQLPALLRLVADHIEAGLE